MTEKQTLAWDCLEDAAVGELLFGGAKCGGKTYLECVYAFGRCLEIIDRFKLGPRKHPIPVGFMGRKVGTHFRQNVLETWKAVIPEEAYTIKRDGKEIVILGAVKIICGGFDKGEAKQKTEGQTTTQRLQGQWLVFACVDQAEELTRDDIGLVRGCLNRPIPALGNEVIPGKLLLTANPRQCWLKDEFIVAPDVPRQRYVQALPADNPHNKPETIETIRNAFKHRAQLLEAYLRGSWDAIGDPDQIIYDAWITAASAQTLYAPSEKRVLACDPARFGDCETVIYGFVNTLKQLQEIFGKKDTQYTANRLHILAKEFGASVIAVDVGGPGAGVVDTLRAMGDKVIEVNSAEKATDPVKYGNRRAEMWDTVGTMFAEGDIEVEADGLEPVLRGQLLGVHYEYKRGRMYVEEKEGIKLRLGRSPDRADAYVLGLSHLRYATAVSEEEKPRRRRRRRRSAMAM